MDPNSQNQRWSEWTWKVRPGRQIYRSWEDVRRNVARFTQATFGSHGEMKIEEKLVARNNKVERFYVIELLIEGVTVHDPEYVERMRVVFDEFYKAGFGPTTTMTMTARLLAGSRQDGTPSDQLLIMPTIQIFPTS